MTFPHETTLTHQDWHSWWWWSSSRSLLQHDLTWIVKETLLFLWFDRLNKWRIKATDGSPFLCSFSSIAKCVFSAPGSSSRIDFWHHIMKDKRRQQQIIGLHHHHEMMGRQGASSSKWNMRWVRVTVLHSFSSFDLKEGGVAVGVYVSSKVTRRTTSVASESKKISFSWRRELERHASWKEEYRIQRRRIIDEDTSVTKIFFTSSLEKSVSSNPSSTTEKLFVLLIDWISERFLCDLKLCDATVRCFFFFLCEEKTSSEDVLVRVHKIYMLKVFMMREIVSLLHSLDDYSWGLPFCKRNSSLSRLKKRSYLESWWCVHSRMWVQDKRDRERLFSTQTEKKHCR